jgi:hypothetical protein
MKWILLAIVALVAGFYLMPVTVNGSVYVVTNSRETVNMPLTEVRAYDRNEFLKVWREQSTFRLNQNCGIGLTGAEKDQMDLRRLREGPNRVPDWQEMDDIYKACSFEALIWDNPKYQPLATLVTDKNGEFSFKSKRFADVIIFSKGSRKVIGNDEKYIWLQSVPSKTLAFSHNVELNNTNLVNELRAVDYPIN